MVGIEITNRTCLEKLWTKSRMRGAFVLTIKQHRRVRESLTRHLGELPLQEVRRQQVWASPTLCILFGRRTRTFNATGQS